MSPQTQSSIIFAGLIVFLCYYCCGSCNFAVAVRDDDSSKETTTTSAFLRRPTDRVLVFNDNLFNNDAAVAEERKLMPLSNNKCGCSTCTEEVINADAGGYSCGSRIDWMVGSMHYSEEDACNLVAGEEFTSGMYIVLHCFVLFCTIWMMIIFTRFYIIVSVLFLYYFNSLFIITFLL
jgi:hypothetical protein